MLKYNGIGLDNFWLQNDYTRVSTGYGPGTVVHSEQLDHAVASHLCERKFPLTGQDFRFLRSMLDMSCAEFGKMCGRDYQVVLDWECAPRKPIPQVVDAIIRQLYLEKQGSHPSLAQTLESVGKMRNDDCLENDESLVFRLDSDGTWRRVENSAGVAQNLNASLEISTMESQDA